MSKYKYSVTVYNGHQTLNILEEKESGEVKKVISFGKKKAEAILASVDVIENLVEGNLVEGELLEGEQ